MLHTKNNIKNEKIEGSNLRRFIYLFTSFEFIIFFYKQP